MTDKPGTALVLDVEQIKKLLPHRAQAERGGVKLQFIVDLIGHFSFDPWYPSDCESGGAAIASSPARPLP